jgi:hypothetical protein
LDRLPPSKRTLSGQHNSVSTDFVAERVPGSNHYFTSRLDVVVHLNSEFVRASEGSAAGVQLAVNDKVSNLLDLKVANGRVQSFYTGWLTGPQRAVTTRTVLRFAFENYAQTNAVRDGENHLEVCVSQYGSRFIGAVIVGSATGIDATTAQPKQLDLQVPKSLQAIASEPFDVPCHLARRCERTDKSAVVAVAPVGEVGSNDAVRDQRTYTGIGLGRDGTFKLRADRPGGAVVPKGHTSRRVQRSDRDRGRRGRKPADGAILGSAGTSGGGIAHAGRTAAPNSRKAAAKG